MRSAWRAPSLMLRGSVAGGRLRYPLAGRAAKRDRKIVQERNGFGTGVAL